MLPIVIMICAMVEVFGASYQKVKISETSSIEKGKYETFRAHYHFINSEFGVINPCQIPSLLS